MATSQQSLDHLILFVPANPTTQLPEVPPFFSDNFTLTPGGFHADGATSNVLILLADGCYIELISFVNPSLAPEHWWGPDANFVGWKDWCLTNSLSPEKNYEAGGRKRADGVDVAWAVTFPKGEKGGQSVRGRVPFFCHDTTPRGVRVPIDDPKTTHPCCAIGVSRLTIIVRDQALLDETRKIYDAVIGSTGEKFDGGFEFRIKRVHEVETRDTGAKIILRLPKNEEEQERVKDRGFWYGDVVLITNAKAGKFGGSAERLDSGERGGGVGGVWLEHA
ncbi:hypothetical protein J4E86_006327 [Alternaria arbusti]|uniref:uncharacterized protein n=1 Tax=Alternaria arbusti TaxID=232088 RepID=UPI00221ED4D0|nr:uncharacterized protein J4E86_006327 [Alternaria arbusti]KAI4955016.1 hypothetical protein J4E86_006327 [Alternaria arbusti]